MTQSAPDLRATDFEPVTIPNHVLAASALLRLAQPFFYAIEYASESHRYFERDLGMWRALRGFARTLLERGATQLSLADGCELREVLNHCPPGRDVDFLRDLHFETRG